MAQSLDKPEEIRIFVPEAITKDGITQYVIQVIIGSVEWTIKHRFKEFVEVRFS